MENSGVVLEGNLPECPRRSAFGRAEGLLKTCGKVVGNHLARGGKNDAGAIENTIFDRDFRDCGK